METSHQHCACVGRLEALALEMADDNDRKGLLFRLVVAVEQSLRGAVDEPDRQLREQQRANLRMAEELNRARALLGKDGYLITQRVHQIEKTNAEFARANADLTDSVQRLKCELSLARENAVILRRERVRLLNKLEQRQRRACPGCRRQGLIEFPIETAKGPVFVCFKCFGVWRAIEDRVPQVFALGCRQVTPEDNPWPPHYWVQNVGEIAG